MLFIIRIFAKDQTSQSGIIKYAPKRSEKYFSSEKIGVPFWPQKLKGRLQNPTFSGKDIPLFGECGV